MRFFIASLQSIQPHLLQPQVLIIRENLQGNLQALLCLVVVILLHQDIDHQRIDRQFQREAFQGSLAEAFRFLHLSGDRQQVDPVGNGVHPFRVLSACPDICHHRAVCVSELLMAVAQVDGHVLVLVSELFCGPVFRDGILEFAAQQLQVSDGIMQRTVVFVHLQAFFVAGLRQVKFILQGADIAFLHISAHVHGICFLCFGQQVIGILIHFLGSQQMCLLCQVHRLQGFRRKVFQLIH